MAWEFWRARLDAGGLALPLVLLALLLSGGDALPTGSEGWLRGRGCADVFVVDQLKLRFRSVVDESHEPQEVASQEAHEGLWRNRRARSDNVRREQRRLVESAVALHPDRNAHSVDWAILRLTGNPHQFDVSDRVEAERLGDRVFNTGGLCAGVHQKEVLKRLGCTPSRHDELSVLWSGTEDDFDERPLHDHPEGNRENEAGVPSRQAKTLKSTPAVTGAAFS